MIERSVDYASSNGLANQTSSALITAKYLGSDKVVCNTALLA